MSAFGTAVEFVLEEEGNGIVSNDPQDPGGLTKWGISQRAYPGLNIRNLTREDAIAIYRKDYWNKCRCGEMPDPLAIVLFDTSVDQGVGHATRILQQGLDVVADGVIGALTMAAIQNTPAGQIVSEFVARRCLAYALNPGVMRFGLGWYRRVTAVHQLALA